MRTMPSVVTAMSVLVSLTVMGWLLAGAHGPGCSWGWTLAVRILAGPDVSSQHAGRPPLCHGPHRAPAQVRDHSPATRSARSVRWAAGVGHRGLGRARLVGDRVGGRGAHGGELASADLDPAGEHDARAAARGWPTRRRR